MLASTSEQRSSGSNCASSGSWPVWAGETAIIVGTGPSATDQSLDIAQGKVRCIAIKSSWYLAPWADVLYGLDRGWWIANGGAKDFRGLKASPSPTACRVFRDIRLVKLRQRIHVLTTEIGTIGCGLRAGGGFSGFQAMNLAVQFGAKKLLLVGFDMTIARQSHWHEDTRGTGKPDVKRTEAWRAALDGCAGQFTALGVKVVNCAMESALKAYPKMLLSEALR